MLYEIVESVSTVGLENLPAFCNHLSTIIDNLNDVTLVTLSIAFNDDQESVEKAINKLSDNPNNLSNAAILTKLPAARDKVLKMIKDHENALALVASSKGMLPDTDQKAIDLLGCMAAKLKIAEAIELVATRATEVIHIRAASYRAYSLSFQIGQRLLAAANDGYDVVDAIQKSTTTMRRYEKILISVKSANRNAETVKYADDLQSNLIGDWNDAVNRCHIVMSLRDLERKLRSMARRGRPTTAFADLRLPGEDLVDSFEKLLW